jgi:hypothetical protein
MEKGGFYLVFAGCFCCYWLMLFRAGVPSATIFAPFGEIIAFVGMILPPDRGLIYLSQGRFGRQQSRLFAQCHAFECLQYDTIWSNFRDLGTGTGQPGAELRGKMPVHAVRLGRNLDYSALVQIEEWKLALPGVFYEVETMRIYPSQVQASHLFGIFGGWHGQSSNPTNTPVCEPAI